MREGGAGSQPMKLFIQSSELSSVCTLNSTPWPFTETISILFEANRKLGMNFVALCYSAHRRKGELKLDSTELGDR